MLCSQRRLAASFAAGAGAAYLYRFNWWYHSTSSCTAASNWHEPSLGSMHQVPITKHPSSHIIFMNLGYTNCSAPKVSPV